MKPKKFPAEKLDLIASKTHEELRHFLSSIPHGERARVLSVLPDTPGFRKNSPAGLEERLRRFIHDLGASGASRAKARSLWPMLWHAWVESHHRLNAALEEFDNSADFVETKGGVPPNTELDVACFEFLARASAAGRTFREEIRAFYDFGYFLPDDRIERHIQEARPESDILLLQRLEPLPEVVSELRAEVARLVHDVVDDASQVTKIRADLTNQGRVLQGLESTLATTTDGLQARIAAIEADKKSAPHQAEVKGLQRGLQEAIKAMEALEDHIERIETASQVTGRTVTALGERLDELAVQFDQSMQQLRDESDKERNVHQLFPSKGYDSSLLEIEECADPTAAVLSTVDPETTKRLVDNLRAVGLNAASAKILSKEVLAGLHADQLVIFSGSAARLIADACALTLAGRRHLNVHIPIGLLDGIGVGRLLAEAIEQVRTDGLLLVLLEGINRSAPEAYADHLRALLHARLLGAKDGVLLIGTLLEGPSTLPIAPDLCEFGPIFDTDMMSWADAALVRAPSPATLSPDSWHAWHSASIEESPVGDELRELRVACEGPPDVLWRGAIRRAWRGLVAAGAGDQIQASLCFGWLLPRAVAAGVKFEAADLALLSQLSAQDKRVERLLSVSRLVDDDD